MKVERAGIDDIDALVKLRLDYLREDYGSLDDQDLAAIRNSLPDYFHVHLGRDLFVYVIRDGKIIISCAFLLVIEKPMSPAFINGRTGLLLNVYTCPLYRRKGYAKAIINTIISEAKKNKLSMIELKSTEDGYPLYCLAGFTDDRSRYHMMKWQNPDLTQE